MAFSAKNIDFSAKICYDKNMDSYFENKITYNQITFCHTNKPAIDEREIHSYHEILLYLGGNAELFTVDGHRSLKSPSILLIPAETYHFLKPVEKSFERLKISFSEGVLSDSPLPQIVRRLRILENLGEDTRRSCDKLCAAMRTEEKYAAFYTYAAFLMLIRELDSCEIDAARESLAPKNDLMAQITEYISQNPAADLSTAALAKIAHVSPSSITHIFKKEFGIPIHKYILQKRLILAERLIEEGEPLSRVALDIGFKDYSSFYKAYIHHFGCAPSDKSDKKEKK